MTQLATFLHDISLGEVCTFRNLQMFPLLRQPGRAAGYHTLGEALALKGLRITEVSDAGSVPELNVRNTLDRPVLLVDGEELLGAKQNRVFNLSILVPAQADLAVPVTCVEAGRWHHTSAEFKRAERAQYAAGRAERMAQVSDSLVMGRQRRSAQHAVWQHIAEKQQRMAVASPTGAMADIYDRYAVGVDRYVEGLPAAEEQAGAVFAIDGQVVGMDLFDAETTFRSMRKALVRSYALDALESRAAPVAAGINAVAQFVLNVGSAVATTFPAIGLGEDLRFRGQGLAGAALVADGELVHLCAYAQGEQRQAAPATGDDNRR